MEVTYAIVKVYVTEHYDVIKCHSIVITIIMEDISYQSDSIIKKSMFRNERRARKSIYHGCEG